jgi:hypothetical protein
MRRDAPASTLLHLSAVVRPPARVGDRQRACSSPSCQSSRRAKTQASWRARNPDYFSARRLQHLTEHGEPGPPMRLPAPLARLPWDLAQDAFKPQGAGFLALFGRVLHRAAQDQMPAQGLDTT